MLDELVKTVRLHLSERLTSPLFGAFVGSWCAWNYRFFLVVLSSESVNEKLQLIDSVVFPSVTSVALRGVLLPALTASLYLFAYPYPARWVYSFTRKRQREILAVRRMIEEETPLTLEDSRRMRREMAQADQSFFEELERKEREIGRLKEQLQTNSVQPESAPSESEDAARPSIDFTSGEAQPLEDREKTMMKLVDQLGGQAMHATLISASKLPRLEAEFVLGELVNKSLLGRRYSAPKRDQVYTFTHGGRAALLAALADA